MDPIITESDRLPSKLPPVPPNRGGWPNRAHERVDLSELPFRCSRWRATYETPTSGQVKRLVGRATLVDTWPMSLTVVQQVAWTVSKNDRQIIRGQLAIPGGLTGRYVASSGREATFLRH